MHRWERERARRSSRLENVIVGLAFVVAFFVAPFIGMYLAAN